MYSTVSGMLLLPFSLNHGMEEAKYAIINFCLFSENSNMLIMKQLEPEILMSMPQWQNVQITVSLLLFDCCYCNSFLSLISYSTDVSENKLLMYLHALGDKAPL